MILNIIMVWGTLVIAICFAAFIIVSYMKYVIKDIKQCINDLKKINLEIKKENIFKKENDN